uniref:DUF243 domain-containing protein n=1 Tax=Glossina morsitans morsitans TaxID=37546 RepID=A0A1B0FP22_GLOMM
MIFSIILCLFGTSHAIQVGYSYQPSDQSKAQLTYSSSGSYSGNSLGNAGLPLHDIQQGHYTYGPPPTTLDSYNLHGNGNIAGGNNDGRGFSYQPLNHPQPVIYHSLSPNNNGGSFENVGSYAVGNNENGGITYQPLNFPKPNTFANSIGGVGPSALSNFGSTGITDNVPAPANAATDYHKEFYVFSAPNNELDIADDIARAQNAAKKTLRVIFIKTPENSGLEKAAIDLAKSALEQKTAIYVLNKDTDLSGLADKLRSLNQNSPNKPEVHFVKYRTNEDAENAKKAIQSQYDSLNGESKHYQEGVAPVLNFASNAHDHLSISNNPPNTYLPA